jgi:phosphoribosylformimino-5-aminoimidazole carboxamide ribotide isomerase
MEGPNFGLYKEIMEKFPSIHIAASGGVRGIDDFKKIRDLGLAAAVFGRAYYEGKISIGDLEKFLQES